jgi:hypothetical protein
LEGCAARALRAEADCDFSHSALMEHPVVYVQGYPPQRPYGTRGVRAMGANKGCYDILLKGGLSFCETTPGCEDHPRL